MKNIKEIPFLGSGLGYRREIASQINEFSDEIGFIEIITEKYISASKFTQHSLAELSSRFVVIPHGVSLSIGGPGHISKTFLREIKNICELVRAPYYSDHLAITQGPGIDLGHLSPITYDNKTLQIVVDNVNRVQDFLGIPFVVENITETHIFPGSQLRPAEFLSNLVQRTDCGILLDVTNLYINSVNFGFDPYETALNYPLDSVVQLHLAGGAWHNGIMIDTHSESTPEPVWKLVAKLSPLMNNLKAALLERDDNYPPFNELLNELRRADSYMISAAS